MILLIFLLLALYGVGGLIGLAGIHVGLMIVAPRLRSAHARLGRIGLPILDRQVADHKRMR